MKITVISRGKHSRGVPTAQVVIKTGTASRTKHLWFQGGSWTDKQGQKYDIPSPTK